MRQRQCFSLMTRQQKLEEKKRVEEESEMRLQTENDKWKKEYEVRRSRREEERRRMAEWGPGWGARFQAAGGVRAPSPTPEKRAPSTPLSPPPPPAKKAQGEEGGLGRQGALATTQDRLQAMAQAPLPTQTLVKVPVTAEVLVKAPINTQALVKAPIHPYLLAGAREVPRAEAKPATPAQQQQGGEEQEQQRRFLAAGRQQQQQFLRQQVGSTRRVLEVGDEGLEFSGILRTECL